MALTLVADGSQTATLDTEHDLSTQTGGGVFVLVVDTGAMVAGDVLELRIYTKVRTGGTERLAYYMPYSHAQFDPNKYSVPVPANIHFRATLTQTDGTGRAFPWALLSL